MRTTKVGSPLFRTAILKLTAYCNLNCSYCYMFNLADRTFEHIRRFMSVEIALRSVSALVEHVQTHGGGPMHLVLHGGEPALWPVASFRRLFREIADLRRAGIDISVSLQTNGYVLPAALLDLLAREDVSIGVSLDGPREFNDRHRVTHAGRGSYDRVVETLARMLDAGFPSSRLGVLSVMNPRMPPATYLEWAAGLPVEAVSLLWPLEYSWANPPWAGRQEAAYARNPLYGGWLADTFVLWWTQYPALLHVRRFVETIARLMGSRAHSDSLGNDSFDSFVVNTDGGIEYPDYLRPHGDGATRTGHNILDTRLTALARDPTFGSLIELRDHLPRECSACPEVEICGGGFLAGRADDGGTNLERRSVLCYDHLYFYSTVRRTIRPYIESLAVENETSSPALWEHRNAGEPWI